MKRMRQVFALTLMCLIVLAQFACADISSQLAEAARPLSDGVPEVAAVRLRNLLNQNLSESDWRAIAEKLLEAMVASNQVDEAWNLLADPRLRQSLAANFWRAQLLASSHREAEALSVYQQIATDQKSSLRSDAEFGAAEMLRALGRTDQALRSYSELFRDANWSIRAQLRAAELYLDKADGLNARRVLDRVQPVTTAEKRERHFLRGRLEMILHRPDRAITIFQSVLKHPEEATHETLTGALFALADAHLQLNTPETGDDALENFIEHRPADVDLARIFAKLDELYRAEKKPPRAELERWTHDPAQPRRALAQWYLARFDLRLGRRDRALEYFSALRRSHPPMAVLASAYLEFARLQLEEGHHDEALAILNEAKALRPEPPVLDRIELLAGQIKYRAKQFDQAIVDFERIGHSESTLASAGIYNAALSWLQKGDEAQFLANAQEFGKKTKDEKSAGDLRLAAGLTEAAKGDPRAGDSLRAFLREFPKSDRASEAWVALAELAFHAVPPRMDEVRNDLAKAMQEKPTAAAQEHAEYLAIWLEDALPGNEAKVIALAKKFIQEHESSILVSSARMKLGELYYRAQDFANAETQFELLTEQNPNNPLTERALFFAGEAAMASMAAQSLDRAIALFDRVVQMNGGLKWAARIEQATIERKLGKPQDALALYEEVLNGAARPAEKREAMCGKGDVLFELAANDPQNYQRAIDAYDKLASDRDVPAHWRNQALFKKGLCLEKKADSSGALASFYAVLEEGMRPERPREFFWFYKAGFNAGQLLEADAKWESAAAVYEKLAAAGGARSDEAKQRLDRIRLEHFLRQE
jgi:TolA-binding protein